jgi:RNA polymerase sigma-70 factor (ECF subfamily)
VLEDRVQALAFQSLSVGRLPVSLPAGGADREVAGREGRGREAAFHSLFDEFQQPIFNYVLRMVGDRDRAADITQDTFIKAYRKLDSLTDESSARSWIYRIATNTAIDETRRRRFFVFGADAGEEAGAYDRPDHRPGPEAQVMASELDDRIQRALMRLRPNHRQCLVLSDIEDMSPTQIAEVMGMSYGAVRTLLCRARGEMRRHLAAEGLIR